MMTFMDFLERTACQEEKYRGFLSAFEKTGKIYIPPPFKKTHLFHLGEDSEILSAIEPIRQELAAECEDGIPMPFQDVSCVSRVPAGEGKIGWILDRVIQDPPIMTDQPPPRPVDEWNAIDRHNDLAFHDWTVKQRFVIVRHTEFDITVEGVPLIPVWYVWFCGTDGSKYKLVTAMENASIGALSAMAGRSFNEEEFMRVLGREAIPVLEQVAAISHPQNYIVRVTPRLTPKEERRTQKTGERPIRKAPHFIVVDHDILVEMAGKKSPEGTHASPVPHHRRGHWMRLAERCKHARLLGKDRVFVRPTYVGERSFTDEKNLYDVLLDFGRKEEEIVA